jgi:hypothetical protein
VASLVLVLHHDTANVIEHALVSAILSFFIAVLIAGLCVECLQRNASSMPCGAHFSAAWRSFSLIRRYVLNPPEIEAADAVRPNDFASPMAMPDPLLRQQIPAFGEGTAPGNVPAFPGSQFSMKFLFGTAFSAAAASSAVPVLQSISEAANDPREIHHVPDAQ